MYSSIINRTSNNSSLQHITYEARYYAKWIENNHASIMHPPCLHHACTMPSLCLYHAFTMPPLCLHCASSMPPPCLFQRKPPCLHHAFTMLPPCLHQASFSVCNIATGGIEIIFIYSGN